MTTQSPKDSEFDLFKLLESLWKHKLKFIVTSFSFAILFAFYSLSLPNIYQSETLLAPTNNDENINNSIGRLNSFTPTTLFRLPSAISNTTYEAIETLESFEFFKNTFLPKINLHDLVAVKEWTRNNNKLSYIESFYDQENGLWVGKFSPGNTAKPSYQRSYRKFKAIVQVREDLETGFIRISVKHHSPYVAKEWLDIINSSINEIFRQTHKRESINSIQYLNDELSRANLTELKQAISELIQEQTQRLMLIESNPEYIFKVIEPPYAPEHKVSPSRFLITIIGAILGFILTFFFVIYSEYFKNRRH